MLVSQDLRLDVAGLIQVALHKALAAAESGDGLTRGGLVEVLDFLAGVGHFHAAATAAEGGLDGNGEAMLISEGLDLLRAGNGVLGARGHRGVGTLSNVTGGDLVTQLRNGLRRWANPDQAGIDDRLGKVGVLREEAIAGVDGVGAGLGGGVEKLGEVEVRLCGVLAAEGKGFVGKRDEWGIGVRLCVDGYGCNARVAGRTDNADRNLTAVGHEDLGDVLGFNCHGRNPPP